jgi:hypothetical protein
LEATQNKNNQSIPHLYTLLHKSTSDIGKEMRRTENKHHSFPMLRAEEYSSVHQSLPGCTVKRKMGGRNRIITWFSPRAK